MLKIKKFLFRFVYPFFMKLLPFNNQKIVFSSYAGKDYSDNPKAISEKLHEICPEMEIVWIIKGGEKRNKTFPSYIKLVKNESIGAAYELYTSKFWVDNVRKSLFFRKRKKTVYIQTWHGTPLKLIEADAGNKLSDRYKAYAKRDSQNMDFLLSGNDYSTEIFKNAFMFKGIIIDSGTPRNDILISSHDEFSINLKNELNLMGKKIILYSPTFRNDLSKNGIPQLEMLEPLKILNAFEKKFNQECILLVRFHPNIADKINIQEIIQKFGNKIVDVSFYQDLHKIFCATDILITDYSSILFDFSILKRPIILFIPDQKEYIEERGFYLNINDLPLCTAKSSAEIEKLISRHSIEELNVKSKDLLNLIGNREKGNASNLVAQKIVELLNDPK